MEAVKSFKKRKYTARLTAGFMESWWEPTVLWTHENQGVQHRTSIKKKGFLVGQEQRGHWALLEHNLDTYQVTCCREILSLTFLGRVYATIEIMSEEIIGAFSETHWGYFRWDQWFYLLSAEKQILKLRARVNIFFSESKCLVAKNHGNISPAPPEFEFVKRWPFFIAFSSFFFCFRW